MSELRYTASPCGRYICEEESLIVIAEAWGGAVGNKRSNRSTLIVDALNKATLSQPSVTVEELAEVLRPYTEPMDRHACAMTLLTRYNVTVKG